MKLARSRVLLLGSIAALISFVVIQKRFVAKSTFDEPLKVTQLDLGIDPHSSIKFHNKVTCLYFSDFMVKQVEFDQPGAEEISIVPIPASQVPPCQQANGPSEIVIDPAVWTGYVEGVKAPYLFLTAADGFGLLHGFAIFDVRTGRKLFDDAIMLNKLFESVELKGLNLQMKYRRAIGLDCSLYRDPKNPASSACWEKTRRNLHLEMPAPDCSDAYRREGLDSPDDASAIPSDIAYDVQAEWDGHRFNVRSVGSHASCGAIP